LSSTASQEPTVAADKPVSSIGGKRDLSKLLAVSPEMICKKLEQLIIKQNDTGQILSSSELVHIKQLIARVPDPTSKEQYLHFIQHLLEDLENIRVKSQRKYSNNTRLHDVDQGKEMEIKNYHAYRTKKVDELKIRREKLEAECKVEESALTRRVRELYSDPQIQYALA
jgi:hypothetical protein